MATKGKKSSARASSVTPLGIIAAFIALSETVAGLAAVKTAGAVQITFAVFAVTFPVLVAGLFFAVLWKRAYVLYPPREFGQDVDVKSYVEAMRHQVINNREIISLVQTSISETFESQEARAALGRVATEDANSNDVELERASALLAENAVERIQQSVIRVDISSIGHGIWDFAPVPELVFRYRADERAFLLLSAIYYEISDCVDAFTYGKVWALEDVASKKLLLPAGIDWSDSETLATSSATVQELGIHPGMYLRAILLPRAA